MSVFKEIHLSPPAKEGCCYDPVGAILSKSDFLSHDQAQMLGPELNFAVEMSEGEYTHLQHLFQTHMEANESDVTDQKEDASVLSPLSTAEAIDLSTSSDGHGVLLPGENTPPCYGEVPGFVLAKIRGEDSLAAPSDNSSIALHTRRSCNARVCLEKRFKSITGTSGDLQSESQSIVKQPTETLDAQSHILVQKWIRSETRNELSGPYIEIYNHVTNTSGAVNGQISHLEPDLQQRLIIPKGFPLNLCRERVLTNSSIASANNQKEVGKKASCLALKEDEDAKSKASKVTPDAAAKRGSSVRKRRQQVLPLNARREKHNKKEKERRRKIRVCCDELNLLVPFCRPDTDKVTALYWNVAYLKYINKIYGDVIKEEFEKTFTDRNGQKTSPSSVDDFFQDRENIPMEVEP